MAINPWIRLAFAMLAVSACAESVPSNGRDAEFAAATAGVDRLDVTSRTAGDPKAEFSVPEPDDVQGFLDLVHFEDEPASGPCLCKGVVDFDLRRGAAPVLHLSLHAHWTLEGVPWGHQAQLTKESSGRICEWLAKHGSPSALGLWNADARRDAADANRVAWQTWILGEDVRRRVAEAAAPADAFSAAFPDADRRATVALWLCASELGARPRDAVSDAATASLDALPPATVLRALDAAGDDDGLARGASVWLVAHSGWERADRADLDRLLPPAIDRLLADGNQDVRAAAVVGLHRLDHPVALSALRRSLRDSDDAVRFLSARELIERRDRDTVPEIRAATEKMSARDRAEITRLLQWM